MSDKTAETKKYKYISKYLYMNLFAVIILMIATVIPAIETQEVELGHGGVYDGAVGIGRDDAGRMLFFDRDLATTVTLGDLYHRSEDHGALLGLGDNDHPQYLLHTELDSLAELEAAIGGVDLISKIEGDTQYLRIDGTNGPLQLYDASHTANGIVDYNWYKSVVTTGSDGSLAIDANTLYVDAVNNRVGISSVMPLDNAMLVVGDETTSSDGKQLLRLNTERPWVFEQIGTGSSAVLNLKSLSVNKSMCISTDGSFTVRNYEGTKSTLQVIPNYDRVGINKYPSVSLDVGGDAAVSGNLSLAAQGGRLTMAGRPVIMGSNLLDNPGFNLWQRNITQTCAAGGNAEGTMTYPQPGTLVTGADRWQISRAGTSMSTLVTREIPPAGLTTAAWCLKQSVVSGAPCTQYLFQAVPREVTRPLRGGWVTFAISHYLAGSNAGGTIAIYKTVAGAVTPLASYPFTSTPDTWQRVAITAQVPADAETLLVSIQSKLSEGGATVSYVANATLAAGRYVSASEIVTDLTASALPPMGRSIAQDLGACQAYYEKGSLRLTGYSPDNAINVHATMVPFNTAKAGAPTVTISNLSAPQLASPNVMTYVKPLYSEGVAYPQGFRFEVSGVTAGGMMIGVTADWTAVCGEPN